MVTTEAATARRRALLIGSPSGGLRGVGECIAAMRGLLRDHAFDDIEIVCGSRATYDRIRQAMDEVLARAGPGDAVVFYYAGHGVRLQKSGALREDFLGLAPMDDDPSTTMDDRRLLLDAEIHEWLASLARRTAVGDVGNVTAILECCNAAESVDDTRWSDADLPAARMEAHSVADVDLERSIVIVVAAQAFEVAGGERANWVGRFTAALVEVVRAVPGEPWRALDFRIRARVAAASGSGVQLPGVVGASDRVPFTTIECEVLDDRVPYAWDGAAWRAELRTGPTAPHSAYWLCDDYGCNAGVLARVHPIASDQLVTVEPLPGTPGDLRWARAIDLLATVEIDPALRAGLALPPGVLLVEPDARRPVDAVISSTGDGVELRDAWGERVARWSRWPPERDHVVAWIARLAEIGAWLASAAGSHELPRDAYELCIAVGDTELQTSAPATTAVAHSNAVAELPRFAADSALTVTVRLTGLHGAGVLYVSVFRIRGDRAVEHLTAASAHGSTATATLPMTLGRADPVLLRWPDAAPDEARVETLAVVVSARALPLHLLERRPLEAMRAVPDDPRTPRPPVRAIACAPYVLVRHGCRTADSADPSADP